MNYNSLCLKTIARSLIVAGLLSLLGTRVLCESSPIANNSPASDSRIKPPGPANKSVADADALDVNGSWKVVQGGDLVRDSTGRWVPSAPPSWSWRMCLTSTGPNAFGGVSFTGQMVEPPITWGAFSGDTLYGGAGVQVLQMRYQEEISGLRFYKLFAGEHQTYIAYPDRVEVLGGYSYVGYPGGGGYVGSFMMFKDGGSCPPSKEP